MRNLKDIALELLDKYEDSEMGCISEGISIIDDMNELEEECKWYREEIEAADAVEVVRCKDCEFYYTDEKWCRRLGLCGAFDADDYCSHGERKETEDE